MAIRQWFIARGDKQEGPHPDERLRELIAGGAVTADTLVWCDGMSTWTRVGEIPGLMSAAHRLSQPAPGAATATAHAGGALSTTVHTWPLFGHVMLYVLADLAVIPLPWIAPMVFRWFVERIELPQQQRVTFAGKPEDIWYVFILYALCSVAGFVNTYVQVLVVPLSTFLILLITRWFFANLIWDGQAAPLKFTGGYWALLG
jgi:hypothetical protein